MLTLLVPASIDLSGSGPTPLSEIPNPAGYADVPEAAMEVTVLLATHLRAPDSGCLAGPLIMYVVAAECVHALG